MSNSSCGSCQDTSAYSCVFLREAGTPRTTVHLLFRSSAWDSSPAHSLTIISNLSAPRWDSWSVRVKGKQKPHDSLLFFALLPLSLSLQCCLSLVAVTIDVVAVVTQIHSHMHPVSGLINSPRNVLLLLRSCFLNVVCSWNSFFPITDLFEFSFSSQRNPKKRIRRCCCCG